MLSESTIQKVKEITISDIIGRYVKLKRAGANMIGCCPFHNEKTGSFTVSDVKGIYKCFGCGESGDGIAFIRKKESLDFIPAIELIAGEHNIEIEYVKGADSEEYIRKTEARKSMSEVLSGVIDKYKNNLLSLPEDHPVMLYLAGRSITREIMIEWSLGWAPPEWRYLTGTLINEGNYEHAAAMGLIKRGKDDSNFDGYRSRIIFPIADHQGQAIGIAGRFLQTDPSDAGKEQAKYINPTDNELYNKSAVLYGLSRAARAIKDRGFAWLTEGYTDVISMHAYGDMNTVATCGTALTNDQAKLLKKYTRHVIILRDGDAAGQKAVIRDIHVLLKEGFRVEVAELEDGKDPDEFIRSLIENK